MNNFFKNRENNYECNALTVNDVIFFSLLIKMIMLRQCKQELSYRKQIARQLHTQYLEGIHRPKYYTVTLKSRLKVTQGHWKRNHWKDHTRLTISRVI